MTNLENRIPICILDESNWSIWKLKTLAYARAYKLDKILDKNYGISAVNFVSSIKNTISDTTSDSNQKRSMNLIKTDSGTVNEIHGFTLEKFHEGNNTLFLRLITTIKDNILGEFINIHSGSALDLWNELLHKYESESTANIRQLLSTVLSMKQGNKPVGIYMAQMLDLCRRLSQIVSDTGANIVEILTTNQMIIDLDSKFNLFKESMLSDDKNLMDIKLEFLIEVKDCT